MQEQHNGINDYLLASGYRIETQGKVFFETEIAFKRDFVDHYILIKYVRGTDSDGYMIAKGNDYIERTYGKIIKPDQFLSTIKDVLQHCLPPLDFTISVRGFWSIYT